MFNHLKLASAAAVAAFLLVGCKTEQTSTKSASPAAAPSTTVSTPAPAPAPAPAPVAPPRVATPAPAAATTTGALPIRIAAGAAEAITDKNGNKWSAGQGFADGETIERPDITVAVGAGDDQKIYQSERYSMTKFTQALPNGKYTVKLHFCETYDGISGAGQRVFSFNVQGKEFKDFDVFAKAGGAMKAYIETVPVEVTNGKLDITFTSNIENPQINGIEILAAN